jgi:hypothetical protein
MNVCCTNYPFYLLVWRSSRCIKSNNKIKEKINLTLQNQWNNNIEEYVDVDHYFIAKKIEKEMNHSLKGNVKGQQTKTIFEKNFDLLIIKNHLPM